MKNTWDEEFVGISIGAGLNALAVFVTKIISENNFHLVEIIINPQIDDIVRLLHISFFITDDIDAMNAWKVISGHAKVLIAVLRDIVLKDIDLTHTAFSNVKDILDDEFYSEIFKMSTTEMHSTEVATTDRRTTERSTIYMHNTRRSTIPIHTTEVPTTEMHNTEVPTTATTDYEMSNLISTTYAMQMQLLMATEWAMEKFVERLDFSSCNYSASSYNACLTAYFDELLESIDQTRIDVVFLGWDQTSVQNLTT